MTEDYLKLPYTIEIFRDETDDAGGWVARVVELPGCMTQGDTFPELAEMLDDAMRTWIESALADGDPIEYVCGFGTDKSGRPDDQRITEDDDERN